MTMFKVSTSILLLIAQCIEAKKGAMSYQISLTSDSLQNDQWTNQGSMSTAGDITSFAGGVSYNNDMPALCFGGSDEETYINYNTNSAVNPKLTMEIWIKPTADPTGTDWLLGHDNGGFDRSIIVYDSRFNGIAMGVGSPYASTIAYPDIYEWTQIIATFDSTTNKATIYKNGGIANGGEEQTVDITADSGGEPNIGLNGLKNYDNHNFVGCIGQVQIVNDVISEKEITKLYKKFAKKVKRANKRKEKDIVQASYTCDSLQSDKWENNGQLNGIDITDTTGDIESDVDGTGIGGICFDPTDAVTYIDVNTNSVLNPQLSMEIWVYPTVTPTGMDWLLGHDNGGFDRSIILYDDRFNGIAAGVGAPYQSTISYPELNEWTQIIVTFDGETNTATIYKNTAGKNGEQESQTVDISDVSGGETNIGLNGLQNYADHTFGGCIGQIQIASGIASSKVTDKLYKAFKKTVKRGCGGRPDHVSLADLIYEDEVEMMYHAGINEVDYSMYNNKQIISAMIILISAIIMICGLIVNRVYVKKHVNYSDIDEKSPLLITGN